MGKLVDSIYQIHNNPFVLAPLFCTSFKEIQTQEKNVLLAYLVLPLVLHEESKKWLINAKSTSSIHSFNKKNANISGLPERVQLYKNLTNQCLQYAIDNRIIRINENLTIIVLKTENTTLDNLEESKKAAAKLYKIFKDLDVVAIYRLLGVKNL
jgi:hypothetical protein